MRTKVNESAFFVTVAAVEAVKETGRAFDLVSPVLGIRPVSPYRNEAIVVREVVWQMVLIRIMKGLVPS